MNRVRSALPALLLFGIVTVVAELVVFKEWVPGYLIPRPTDVLGVFFTDPIELWGAFESTTLAAISGFLLSGAIGIAVAIMVQRFPWIDRAVYPYAVFFQTVPIVAIAPLLVIWLGFGVRTVIASSAIVCIFPIISNTLDGLRSAPKNLLDLFQLYSAPHLVVLFRLRLPGAISMMLSGLKVASGLAVIGAIVGEFIAGGGIGGLVDVARTQQRVDKVFAAILMGSFLGLGLVKLVDALGTYFVGKGYHEKN